MKKVLIIVGPTASGKTRLSIELALRYNGEVISADSRQVYRGLDIGTGKVTQEEMQGIPHHLLDVANPQDVYTVADFVRDGRATIEHISSRKKLPIIVGGTFFYVDALLGKTTPAEVSPNPALREELENYDTPTLLSLLQEKDPERAKTIDTQNRRRLVRALEIVEELGSVPIAPAATTPLYETLTIGISLSRDTLRRNIESRLAERLTGGMVEEVESLRTHGISTTRMHDLGIEYTYISEYLEGNLSFDEMKETIITKSMQYAKRQMTWLKRDTSIHWIEGPDVAAAQKLVEKFFR